MCRLKFISQKGQDRWFVEEVLAAQEAAGARKRSGYFLDLAASDGVSMNNTLLLEREFGWTGVAIEADPTPFDHLRASRNCVCVQACVDELPRMVEYLPTGNLGGIIAEDTDNSPAVRADLIEQWRSEGKVMEMQSSSLEWILDRAGAPPVIDYFSFDVEGAETRIMRRFPFHRYRFDAITVERPTPELNELLFAHGYLFVRNAQFDTFYVHESLRGLQNIRREPFEQVPRKDW